MCNTGKVVPFINIRAFYLVSLSKPAILWQSID